MITLIISVYAEEKPEFLNLALYSIEMQGDRPDEMLLIKDGPIGIELEDVIEGYSAKLGFRVIALPENQGLARALNAGLREAKFPWIMRFDSDDFCVSDRVARQRALIEANEVDLFGGQILEFNDDPSRASRSRFVPTLHTDIVRFAQKRNPFNHMTVCYRRDLALLCGGYPEIPLMEDYALWIKMLVEGARCTNDTQPVVMARVGNGMISRRGGLRYAKSEIMLQYFMVREGFKPVRSALVHAAIRISVFIMPPFLRAYFYKKFLRS